MPSFISDGITLHYEVHGAGQPIVLIHGFGSSGKVNWIDTGWVGALTDAGFQAVTIDNRGHGQSDKLYDPAYYHPRLMAEDAARLNEHLNLGAVPVMGYSMGAHIAAWLAIDRPGLVSALVLGGLGARMTTGMADSKEIIAALEAGSLGEVSHPTGRVFRIFADHTGSDRRALAACVVTSREPVPERMLARITMPALVAVGSDDAVAGPPGPLAALLPRGEVLVIERRDHMRATGDAKFKAGAIAFLQRALVTKTYS